MCLTMKDLEICHSLAVEAREILERVDAIESLATRCTFGFSEAPGISTVSDKVGDGAAELTDFIQSRRKTAQAYFDHVAAVEYAIDGLADSYQRRVLRYRYVDGLTWDNIRLLLHYAEAQTFRIHAEALKNLGIPHDDSK